VDFVTGLLPTWEPVDFGAIGDTITGLFSGTIVGNLLAWLNFYFPIREAFTTAGVLVGLYVGVLVYKLVVWGLTKAHVLGGAD
jgi:hypothetical protein